MLFNSLLSVLFLNLLSISSALISTPTVTTSGNYFFDSNGNRFFIKGVAYANSNSLDPLSLPNQCEIDAASIKALGANVVNVYAVDPTLNHDGCMQAFEQNGIYVTLGLKNFTSGSFTWNMDKFKEQAAILDAFSGYDNLLAFYVGNEVISQAANTTIAPSIKAAVASLKQYRDLRGHRKIPIGYASDDDAQIRISLFSYFSCGGVANNTVDFLGLNLYSWCGTSTYTESGYSELASRYGEVSIPLLISETGCNLVEPRDFSDQVAVFGSSMTPLWSGAVIYMWQEMANNYGLVSYTSSSMIGTPTPLQDYSNLQSKWSTLTPTGVHSSAYTWTGTTPACPTTDASWSAASTASLSTIAHSVLVSLAGVQVSVTSSSASLSSSTASATSIRSSTTPTSTGAPATQTSTSTTPVAKIVIGVVIPVVVIAILGLFFFWWKRRKARQLQPVSQPDSSDARYRDKQELDSGPIDPTIAGPVLPKHELAHQNTHKTGNASVTPLPPELHGRQAANTPWNHSPNGYMPPELGSIPVLEAGSPGRNQIDQGLVTRTETTKHDSSHTTDRFEMFTDHTNSSQTHIETAPLTNEAEILAEEADAAVQELGWINMRRKTLIGQAKLAGHEAENVPGRRGEEYRDLVDREDKIRKRLDDIETEQRQVKRS